MPDTTCLKAAYEQVMLHAQKEGGLQVMKWYQRPEKECRHSFISTHFDGTGTKACGSRCDICTGESSKFNVQMQFEFRIREAENA
jgi:hypothetical protein